jgi:hypothetical protein
VGLFNKQRHRNVSVAVFLSRCVLLRYDLLSTSSSATVAVDTSLYVVPKTVCALSDIVRTVSQSTENERRGITKKDDGAR